MRDVTSARPSGANGYFGSLIVLAAIFAGTTIVMILTRNAFLTILAFAVPLGPVALLVRRLPAGDRLSKRTVILDVLLCVGVPLLPIFLLYTYEHVQNFALACAVSVVVAIPAFVLFDLRSDSTHAVKSFVERGGLSGRVLFYIYAVLFAATDLSMAFVLRRVAGNADPSGDGPIYDQLSQLLFCGGVALIGIWAALVRRFVAERRQAWRDATRSERVSRRRRTIRLLAGGFALLLASSIGMTVTIVTKNAIASLLAFAISFAVAIRVMRRVFRSQALEDAGMTEAEDVRRQQQGDPRRRRAINIVVGVGFLTLTYVLSRVIGVQSNLAIDFVIAGAMTLPFYLWYRRAYEATLATMTREAPTVDEVSLMRKTIRRSWVTPIWLLFVVYQLNGLQGADPIFGRDVESLWVACVFVLTWAQLPMSVSTWRRLRHVKKSIAES